VIEAAKAFAGGTSPLQPLNPEFDQKFLEIVDGGDLDELDKWSNAFVTDNGGNSGHEIRTWAAAFAALAAAGPYRTGVRYYRPVPELIAGFAVRTAVHA
jgi:2,3-dihydroxyphenylpropionate 1,2-dioxygenase